MGTRAYYFLFNMFFSQVNNKCFFFHHPIPLKDLRHMVLLRGTYRYKIFFFIIRFNAIMHRTTIVQNKIISIICSCLFFCLPNIYRPSLGKMQLGRPTQTYLNHSIFISEGNKKNIPLGIVCTTLYYRPIFNFLFHLFLKNYFKNV